MANWPEIVARGWQVSRGTTGSCWCQWERGRQGWTGPSGDWELWPQARDLGRGLRPVAPRAGALGLQHSPLALLPSGLLADQVGDAWRRPVGRVGTFGRQGAP